MNNPRWSIVCCMALCVACGMADTVGFLTQGVFAGNMTGNTVHMALALVQRQWSVLAHTAALLVCFLLGVIFAHWLLLRNPQRTAWVLGAEAVLLGLAAWLLQQGGLFLLLTAFAMGMQATAVTKFAGVTVSTVVMTTTLRNIAEAAVDRWSRRTVPVATSAAPTAPAQSAALKLSPAPICVLAWLSYFIGVGITALVRPPLGLLLSALMVLAVAVAIWAAARPNHA